MARGRKAGPSRLDMRKQADAAEAREKPAEDEEEKEEDEEADADAEDEEAGDDEGDDGDDDEKPKAKAKAKAKVKKVKDPTVKKAPVKRTRAVKEVRMRAIWVILDNGSKVLETFPYPQKADAEEFLAKKIEEKKGTFYLQMRKEVLD